MIKFTALCAALVLCLCLAACGSSEQSGTTTAATEAATTAATETTTEATETTTEAVFEEVVIVDNEDLTFRITAIDGDSFWGYTLTAFVENKTDGEITLSLSDVSVNGFMCDPFWAVTVPANAKANEDISFLSANLEQNGIETVTEITFTLKARHSDALEPFFTDTQTLYPLGEEAVVPYVREPGDSDVVLVDNEFCTVILTGTDPDSTWGYALNVYIENKTDASITVSAADAVINGFAIDPYWTQTVAAGKRSYTDISWFETALEENGIETVENIRMTLRAYDPATWQDCFRQEITIEP